MEKLRAAFRDRPWLLSVVVAAATLPVKLFGYAVGYLNIHAARDWERGWQMLHGVRAWWHGPELLFGGSIPGFFFNILAGLFQVPHRNPFFAAMGPALLFCVSVGFFHDAVRRLFRPRPALLSTIVYAVFPLGTLALRYYWNPSYLFVFTTLTLWCVARAIADGRRNFMAGAVMAALLASQIHLSGYSLVIAVIGMMFLLRMRPGWGWLLLVLAIHVGFLAPYYISQSMRGWPDINMWVYHKQIPEVDVMRVAPTHNFLSGVGLQLLVKPPGWEQAEPFSYFERFYREAGTIGRLVGRLGWFLSLGVLALFLQGAYRLLRRSPEDPVARNAAAFARMALLVFLVVCLPVLLWNPALGAERRTDQPLRYYFIFWPAQFIVMAYGMNVLLGHAEIRRSAWRKTLTIWTGVFAAVCLMFTGMFMQKAIATGKPFQYIKYVNISVHALRDKVEAARFLRTEYGVTEDLFLTRVHTAGDLLHMPEESLDYEMRSAIENHPDAPEPDPSLYYFLFESEDLERLAGKYREVELRVFGSLGVLVYRPTTPVPEDWQIDPPVSWWWY